jgi:predicted NBD/HSP70 family sugar kinase
VPRIPATPALLRELNERTVLEVIRASAPISRADVARTAGLSKPTVSLSLESLLAAGLVREVGVSSGHPGRGARLFEPAADAGFALGIDIGARFVRGAIADLAGTVRARRDVPLPRPHLAAALTVAAGLRRDLERDAGAVGAVVAATVGVPAAVPPGRGTTWLGALDGLEDVDVAALVHDRLSIDASVENDVNLAAVGELRHGLGRDVRDFVFLSVGSGLGAGIVLGGELHRGFRGAAGEVDLVPFRSTAPGTAADEIDPSRDGLAPLVARSVAGARDAGSLDPTSDVREVFVAARAGETLAGQIVAEEARRIALYVAAIVAVVDPELVVLGGGIGSNADLLLDPVRAVLASLVPRPPRVETSTLGSDAVLAGALVVARRVALDHVFANRLVRERSPA